MTTNGIDLFLPREVLLARLNRLQWAALIVGLLGAAAWALGLLLEPARALQSYLFAYLYWVGIPLGCLAIAMLHYLVGGAWGFFIRRTLEAAAMTLPLMLLLFAPVLFGMGALFPWVGSDSYPEKAFYLNVPFFIIRAVVYFGVWIGSAYLLNRWEHAQDRSGDPRLSTRLRLFSRFGLIAYFLTVTFAAFDWAMSIEPDWFSSIFGLMFVAGQGLTAMSLAVLVTALLARFPPLKGVVSPSRFGDLSGLLLVFVMFWAYITLSQYLIIWSGNLPEEVAWYVHRSAGGWRWVIIGVIALQFALPFLILLSRTTKRAMPVMIGVALLVLCVHVVEQYWRIIPSYHTTGLSISWLDFAAPIGIGGLWVAAFAWLLKRQPLLPAHDPLFTERSAPAREAYEHG